MEEILLKAQHQLGIQDDELMQALEQSLADRKDKLQKVLLIPPDFTRNHSGAGKITAMYYKILKDTCHIDIMPALGTHMPVSRHEQIVMFGDEIPEKCFMVHRWREDVVKIGEVPNEYVKDISEGLMNCTIDVEVNRCLVDGTYDLIISIGQVVPHVIVGMANYSKNIFVGCGGKNMISQTHMLGAVYGMERLMGRDNTPVRKVFDYAEENCTQDIPLLYVLTVTTQKDKQTCIDGVFIGQQRKVYEEAVSLSQEKNITFVDKPLKKVVAYLDKEEFKSTWLGNKAIYRTRMAIADGGELIVLGPGIKQFGEDEENDRLIRKYGYVGREQVLNLFEENKDLQDNQSVTAHLIHGSTDGRFSVTYAVEKLTREEVEGVGFRYMGLSEAYCKYDPNALKDGFNVLDDGEEIYFISSPTLGLWADKNKF